LDKKEKLNVITDENGKRIVLINDIRFKTRHAIDWKEVEAFDFFRELSVGARQQIENVLNTFRELLTEQSIYSLSRLRRVSTL